MIIEWFVGFHRPRLRNAEGRIDPHLWLGHCEIWGYTPDETWLFIDPSRAGTLVRVTHHFEDVSRHLAFRAALCDSILRITAHDPHFRFPLHGMMTCASVCGGLLGIRALLPHTLRRKLLAKGAEVIHGQEAERGPERCGRTPPPTTAG